MDMTVFIRTHVSTTIQAKNCYVSDIAYYHESVITYVIPNLTILITKLLTDGGSSLLLIDRNDYSLINLSCYIQIYDIDYHTAIRDNEYATRSVR